MKIQWILILSLIFALIVAIFAVINVEPVHIDYVFGATELPLIIIILSSALLGGFILGTIGLYRNFILQRRINVLKKEIAQLKESSKNSEYELESKEHK